MISAGDVGGNFTIVILSFLVNLFLHVLARSTPTFRIRLLYLEKKEARTHRPYHSFRVVLSLSDFCLHDVASSQTSGSPLLWYRDTRRALRLNFLEAVGLEGVAIRFNHRLNNRLGVGYP